MADLLRDDTIAAIATGIGGAGIGIVRVSGPQAVELVEPLFDGVKGKKLAEGESHKLIYGQISDPLTGEVIDEALVSKMNGPHSYTAEDVVEINCHGGIVSLKAILKAVLVQGARLAEPGEFTKRAFLNGRLDLTQAEAVMDIISAKTQKSLSYSVAQLEGKLGDKLNHIDEQLMALMVDMEANIDYPEYEIPDVHRSDIEQTLTNCQKEIDVLLAQGQAGKIYREGITTAILGEPNVGKSSLLNSLLMENKAIVTDIPGTTRDTIEEYLNLDGIPFRVIDTAGIRETDNLVEEIGVKKSRALIEQADLVVFMTDLSRPLTSSEESIMAELNPERTIYVANKLDIKQQEEQREGWLELSLLTDEGIEALKQAMVEKVFAGGVDSEAEHILSNSRQIGLLEKARSSLSGGLETLNAGLPLELIAIDINDALTAIREISGKAIGEDVINNIFAKFCIGK